MDCTGAAVAILGRRAKVRQERNLPENSVISWVVAMVLAFTWLGQGPQVQAGQGYALTGVGGGPDSFYGYQGIMYAPLGSLSETGPLIRVWGKGFHFTYEADLGNGVNRTIDAFGTSVEAEAGWQFANDAVRLAVLAGAAWRDHRLSPDDPGSDLEDGRVGFLATIDGDVRLSDRFGVMAYANYLTGFDQYWVQVKPYVQTQGGWKIGPEFVVSGADDYQHGRAGVFVNGFELDLGSVGRVYLGGEAGARFDLDNRNVDPYAGLNAGFLF